MTNGTVNGSVEQSALVWPSDFVWRERVGRGEGKPLLVMFFNLECPGCISRGVPLLKRWYKHYAGKLDALLIHTSYSHKQFARDEVEPQLLRFAERFARIDFPIALDLSGDLAKAWGVEGTPHWFLFGVTGRLERSIYGSQRNAETRLEYALEVLVT